MTKRDIAIAILASFLGIGGSLVVAGAASPTVDPARGSLRFFPCSGGISDAGTEIRLTCFEVCQQAMTGETIVEQGCESANVPPALKAEVDSLIAKAINFWKTKRGL